MHRRLLHDDHKGVGEALNETGITGKGLVCKRLVCSVQFKDCIQLTITNSNNEETKTFLINKQCSAPVDESTKH